MLRFVRVKLASFRPGLHLRASTYGCSESMSLLSKQKPDLCGSLKKWAQRPHHSPQTKSVTEAHSDVETVASRGPGLKEDRSVTVVDRWSTTTASLGEISDFLVGQKTWFDFIPVPLSPPLFSICTDLRSCKETTVHGPWQQLCPLQRQGLSGYCCRNVNQNLEPCVSAPPQYSTCASPTRKF